MYENILQEELKNKVAQDWFFDFDCTKIIGKIDFCACLKNKNKTKDKTQSLIFSSVLWAEVKKDVKNNTDSLVLLVLTIGKAKTYTQYMPPAFLAAFDAKKITFVPYKSIQEVFNKNDFNWNVAPSCHTTKEFKLIKEAISATLYAQKDLAKLMHLNKSTIYRMAQK